MNIKEIIKDSIYYPFSDWKKILVLGIIVLITNLSLNQLMGTIYVMLDTENIAFIIIFLTVIGLLGLFIGRGYQLRIIKSTIEELEYLPKFNDWIGMLKDGIKVSIVIIVYLIPLIIIFIGFKASLPEILQTILSNISSLIANTVFNGGINALIESFGTWEGIFFTIGFIYMVIIFPISLMSIANMANNNSKLVSAFNFSEIKNIIGRIGLKNLIVWYITTEIGFLVIWGIMNIIIVIISNLINPFIGILLNALIVISYLYMYLSRSVGLFYITN
jgi:hypothetical protein